MLKRLRALLGRRGRKTSGETRKDEPVAARPAPPAVHRGPTVVRWPLAEADLDPDAVKIVRRLTRFDHRAYLVGGCVRDLLLDRKPKDFDIGTSATPRQIKRVFRNCRIIGRRFRLAHIYFQNGKIIEVATFRASDGPEGAEVAASDDLLIRDDNVFGTPEEDALRRDFTINSLFYDLGEQTVLDYADGLGDLRRKVVRTIGDPDVRFREDPIRILRAIKFAARLDFTIEPRTRAALEAARRELDRAATARILEEINRFCRGGAARRSFELLRETEVFGVVFPELARAYAEDSEAWGLLLDLLRRMDESGKTNGAELRSGEFFMALVLPLLAREFGWTADGATGRAGGLNLRQVIDDRLRDLSLRLRVPRREQEYCRLVLGTLYRMVPCGHLRRGAKRAILSRECLPGALGALEVLAQRWGGSFAEALAFWSAGRDEHPPVATPASPGEPTPRRGRRRGGRRRRGSRGGSRPATGDAPVPAPAPAAQRQDLPPVWDDAYFFAALPSAPEDDAQDDRGDRYGAEDVAPREAETEAGTQAAAETEAEAAGERPAGKPRRRRRGGRRRRRKPGGGGAEGDATPDARAGDDVAAAD
jgi:poly(A) polymerase